MIKARQLLHELHGLKIPHLEPNHRFSKHQLNTILVLKMTLKERTQWDSWTVLSLNKFLECWVFAFEKNKHPQLYKHTQTHFNTHNPQYNIREIQKTTNVLFPTQCNNFSSRTPTGIAVCIPWFSWAIRWTACFSLLPMCRPGFRDHELSQAVQEPRGTKPDIERKCWYHHANSHKSSTYNSYSNSW